MIYSPSDTFTWLVAIVFAVLLIALPFRWLVKLVVRTIRNRDLDARKTTSRRIFRSTSGAAKTDTSPQRRSTKSSGTTTSGTAG